MAKKALFEGFTQNVGSQLRDFFARSPQQQSFEIRRGGSPSSEQAGMPFNLASQFGYDSLSQHLRVDQDLQTRYTDYEEMDEYPEISAVLDMYADDSTIPEMSRGKSIWVTSENQGVSRDLDDMLHRRIMVDQDIWGVARTLSKYGNVPGEILATDQGVIGMNYLPPATVRRIEGPRGELLGFVQDVRGEFNIGIDDFYKLAKQRAAGKNVFGDVTVFEDWEMVHWRLRGKHLRSVYGHGVIDPARWVWKRLALLEDAILIYKLSRAPSRYAFYVDVGGLDQERGLAFVNRVKNQFVKKRFVNPQTGKLDMRHNPLAHDENFFIPTRDGKDSTRIEVLQGPDYAEVETLEYHRDKLVSALKVPKSYMGYGGEATRGALSSEDIRFARTVMRIQAEMRAGYRQVCRVHMVACGASRENIERYDYDVQMSVPSAIMELAKLEVMSATADLADRMGERVPNQWILTNLYKFTEQEAEALILGKNNEILDRAKIDAQVQTMLAQAGGMGGGMNGGMGDDDAGNEQVSSKHGTAKEIERRITALLKENQTKTMRQLEAKIDSKWKIEDKLDRLLNEDASMRRRMQGIEGLLSDIRQSRR